MLPVVSDLTPASQVDTTLAALPNDQHSALQHLRETIAAAAPEAEESISYGAPAFRYHGKTLVAYSASKAHCSFFPMGPELIERHRAELDGFVAAKGTLHFTPERPIPDHLVELLVRERMALIDGA